MEGEAPAGMLEIPHVRFTGRDLEPDQEIRDDHAVSRRAIVSEHDLCGSSRCDDLLRGEAFIGHDDIDGSPLRNMHGLVDQPLSVLLHEDHIVIRIVRRIESGPNDRTNPSIGEGLRVVNLRNDRFLTRHVHHGPERLRYVRGALESEGVPALPVIIRCPADPALGIASVDTRDQSFQGTGDLVNGSRIGWLTPFWQHARLDPRYAFIRTWRQLDERFMLSRPCGAHPLHAIRRRFTLRNARLRTYLHRDRKPNGVI